MNPYKSVSTKLSPMIKSLDINWQKVNTFRRTMHQFPQGAFKQFETGKRVVQFLKNAGLQQKWIKKTAKTGFVIDIQNPSSKQEQSKHNANTIDCIAIRGDMDALLMKEQTGIAYSSKTDHAHMCGHDGHTTCLLSTADFLIRNRDKIPSNKRIRLLFQPAEQQIGGAAPMIKQGCLDGVDQVYGYHNYPQHPVGVLAVQPYQFMSSVALIKIVIEGKGGHGSIPHANVNPITPATLIYQSIVNLPALQVNCKEKAVVSITKITSGTQNNVIPRTAVLEGTIRTFNKEVMLHLKQRIEQIATSIAKSSRCVINDSQQMVQIFYPAVMNHKKETQHVEQLAKQLIGEKNLTRQGLPAMVSEDFSYYLEAKPGCLMFFGSGEYGKQNPTLHSSYFNYPDQLTPIVTCFWIKLIQKRLGISLID